MWRGAASSTQPKRIPSKTQPMLTRFRILQALLALAVAVPAQDDRESTTPTGAIWLPGQTTTDVSNLTAAGWRLTDLEIEATSPFRFTIAAVRNTGSYAKGWWWAVGVTGAQLATTISQNNARIIDLEAYDDSGTTRFAAILISNTGADAKAWWWLYDATSSSVNSAVSSNGARLTNFERYTKSGVDRFAVVMISNTGADARTWNYYYGATSAYLNAQLSQNGARIYTFEHVGTDSYDAVTIRNNGTNWWYNYGLTASQVTDQLEQNAGRLIDIERYSTVLGYRFDIAIIDNANALERTVRARFASSTDGAYGAFLKEVNGPILAQLRPDFVFEPASLLKTMYHTHAMRRVRLGLDNLGSPVTLSLGLSGSCPTGGGAQTTEPLETVLRLMMENSDNNRTYATELRFGRSNINATGQALGCSAAQINHSIGCGGNVGAIPNRLTLRDVDVLHEAVANGYLGTQREKFYELMANGTGFPTWGTSDLDAEIDAEALSLGMPTVVRDAFKAALLIAYKPGGYGVGGLLFYCEGGFVRIPFKNSQGVITGREFVFGSFNHDSTFDVPARNAVSDVSLELVWSQVRPALLTWNNQVSGSLTSFGTGCAGSAGTPLHGFAGTPDIGNNITYSLTSAPGGTTAFLMIGFSNASWNGARLPYSLAGLGAAGCSVRVDPQITLASAVLAGGVAQRVLHYPYDTSLIGARLYTQYLVVDNRANALGLTSTNGVTTQLGGYR